MFRKYFSLWTLYKPFATNSTYTTVILETDSLSLLGLYLRNETKRSY